MTLTEFQTLALRTATFPEGLAFQYLEPALSCEIWEVVGVRAKHVRDCKTDQNLVWGCASCRERMLLELGDVLWFAVVLLKQRGCPLPGIGLEHPTDPRLALTELQRIANVGRVYSMTYLHDVIWWTEEIAEAMGSSLDEVMRMNVAKLEKRHGLPLTDPLSFYCDSCGFDVDEYVGNGWCSDCKEQA